MTIDEIRDYLRTRYPALGEITDDLEGRGLQLIRFSRSEREGRRRGYLKFAGLPDDYILAFVLQPSEVRLWRCNGRGGMIPVALDELSPEAVARAIWGDTMRF